MRICRRTTLLLTLCLLSTGCESDPAAPGSGDPFACVSDGDAGTPYEAGVNCRTIDIDGYPRSYIVYVPPGHTFTSETPAPLVFMFHGSGGFGERFLRISGWREKADEVGLVAVFPTAMEYFVLDEGRVTSRWHEFGLPDEIDPSRRPTSYPANAPWPADDVVFTRSVIDDISALLPIDSDAIFASGFSNGATFTSRLAIEATDRFAAFAWVGGGFCTPVAADWTSATPRPTWMVLGGADHKLLEYLSVGGPSLDELPLEEAALLDIPNLESCLQNQVAAWDLAWSPRDARELNNGAHIEWRTPASVDRGNTFQFTVVSGLDHRYPNGRNNPLGVVAVDWFWEFFSSVP